MAKVKFNKKEFESHIKLTKEIEEKINLFGTPLEISDNEMEIEVFPNRPDMLSLQGFLRSFKAFLGKEKRIKKYKIIRPEKNYKVKISSAVKTVRPYTACAIVKNLKFDDEKIKEIIDLQEKLHLTLGRNRKKVAIGIYPLEKITLPINYDALPPEKIVFVPLEKEKEMNGAEILKKHSTGNAYAHLLENFEKFPVFSDAKSKIMSMPPIINSEETGKITEKTTEVFIECSGFDMNVLKKCLNIIVTTLAEMGGAIFQMELDYGKEKIKTPDLSNSKIKISLENINKIIGLDLKEKDLESLLPRMGYEYKNKIVKIPAWRTDVLHEVDIAEDIAIAYGYDKLIPQIPNVATSGKEPKESGTTEKITEILIGLGLIETSSFHLIKQKEVELMKPEDKIEVENSKTEYKFLRPNLLIPALRIFSENKDHDYPQEIFEIGAVFSLDDKNKTENGINERINLTIALSPANFTRIKQIFSYLF